MCAWAVLSLVSALWAGCQQSAAGSSTPDSSPGAPTAGRSFYVVPSGDDSAAGTQKLPWRTVARASAELAPGDTLFLGGGVYRERGIVMTRAGTANAPITIRSVATELPVIDGGFAEFRDAGNSDWEICDPARGIYRSKKPFSAVERAYGYLGPTDGGYPLVPYESYAALSSVI
ncbi:MAG TPA: hypothetical protein VK348_00675, partial [Planctomycetota bacterium]|nr:hypothetical protein [Planctomycetota bacterium]